MLIFIGSGGDLCAAKFSEDNEWYRAKVEKVQGGNVSILYIDYGNKEVRSNTQLIFVNISNEASSLDPFLA